MAMYEYVAKKDKETGLIRFQLKDHAGELVADGTGKTVSAAQQDALEATNHAGAQVYLGQVKFPELPD